jgi:hypothetical protein
MTGIASQTAEVLHGTSQFVKLRCASRFSEDPGIGSDAGQTLVSVCPARRTVLQPWAANVVEELTQLQFL